MDKVLIVEDDLVIQNGLKKIINEIDENINTITTGYSKKALQYASTISIDLFLIDIQLKDYSGIELAKQIRQISKYTLTPIIFITATPTKELEAFRQIHCYDYITKPFNKDDIKLTIETIINYDTNDNVEEDEYLYIKQKNHSIAILQDDIIYIEALNKKIFIYTINETYKLNNISMTNLSKKLKSSFKRCHKGYIVNIDYILKINVTLNEVYLKNIDQIIPIGRKYKYEFIGVK